ncbi:MAG: DUF4202 domain-containing protein [Limisphaerales bacterium]
MERLQKALARFDAENARDPNMEIADGAGYPRELLYARRLTGWVLKLSPEASESLRLAARCQHLCRWMIPRETQPMTRPGYLRWRNELREFHARRSAEILREVGYPEEIIEQVRALNLKRHFPADPESRVLEDALCLVFLEFQFADLAGKTPEDKVINAVKKSWQKMTPAARERALALPLSKKERELIERALRD